MRLNTEAETKSPAEVRARVLAEHAELRAVIRDVDRLAGAVAAEDLRCAPLLRERAAALYRLLAVHMEGEERDLAPLIYRIDAWGPVRLEQMRRDHGTQLAALDRALEDLALQGPALGETVQSTCWDVLHDMRCEEHDLLHPDLWREDGLVIEIGG